MPELPEVETTVKELSNKVVGKKIVDIWTDTPKLIKNLTPKKFKEIISNKKITTLQRKGKNILIFLEGGFLILVHQKLTGHLLYGKWKKEKNKWIPEKPNELSDPMNRFIHLILFLDNGKMLALSDLRKFAKVLAGKSDEILALEEIKNLGVDPLSKEFNLKKFKEILSTQKRPIKTVLMDQNLIAGIGNIYSDEALWLAKISPLRKANQLTEKEISDLLKAIKKILKEAIKHYGTSIIDYRRPDGSRGEMDKFLKVYRREGKKCFRCNGIIKRVKINGRSAHFCPVCQK